MGSRQPKNTFVVRDNEDLDVPQTSPTSLSWDLELSCVKQNKQTTTATNLHPFRPGRAVSLDLRREEVFAHQPSVWSTELQRHQLLWCGPQRPHHLTPVSLSSITSSTSQLPTVQPHRCINVPQPFNLTLSRLLSSVPSS